jgi:hypothetical protein
VLYAVLAAGLVLYVAWLCVKMATHAPAGGIALIAAGIGVVAIVIVGLISSRFAS